MAHFFSSMQTLWASAKIELFRNAVFPIRIKTWYRFWYPTDAITVRKCNFRAARNGQQSLSLSSRFRIEFKVHGLGHWWLCIFPFADLSFLSLALVKYIGTSYVFSVNLLQMDSENISDCEPLLALVRVKWSSNHPALIACSPHWIREFSWTSRGEHREAESAEYLFTQSSYWVVAIVNSS